MSIGALLSSCWAAHIINFNALSQLHVRHIPCLNWARLFSTKMVCCIVQAGSKKQAQTEKVFERSAD
jgi:hypothetical protein